MSHIKIEDMVRQIKFLQGSFPQLSKIKKTKLESIEKTLKFIEKSIKQYKLSKIETEKMYEATFQYCNDLILQIQGEQKKKYSDFQSTCLKLNQHENKLLKQIEFSIQRKKELDDYQKSLNDIDLKMYNYSIEQLCGLGGYIFEKIQLCKKIGFTQDIAKQFLLELSTGYNIVPYHNFTHAFSVFIMFYQSYKKSSFSQLIDQFQLVFSLIACLGHDLGHQGYNNLYQTKTQSGIAIDYGYQGPLEKMHLRKTIKLLKKIPKNPFLMIDKLQVQRARRIITKAIISTDMAKHFLYVDELKNKVSASLLEQQGKGTELTKYLTFKPADVNTHEFFIECLVHSCDIGNPIYEFENYINWANLLCLEFNNQTIKQECQKIEVTTFLKYTTLSNFYRTQISFSNTIVLPIWQQLAVYFPELDVMKERIIKNVRKAEQFTKRKSIQYKNPLIKV